MKLCWHCGADLEVKEDFYGDTRCPKCWVLNSIHNPADIQPTKEETKMGKLKDKAMEKSPYLRLEIGQETSPMVYRNWKEVVNNFGQDSFRYSFDVTTENGVVTKTLDVASLSFAMVMDEIPFNSRVVIIRKQKTDSAGEPIEDKSFYDVRLAE